MISDRELITKVVETCGRVPYAALSEFVAALDSCVTCPHRPEANRILGMVTQPKVRELLTDVVDLWRLKAPKLSGREMVFALQIACAADAHRRDQQSVELVWTGPAPLSSTMRRTEQALLNLIEESSSMLTVVTFAAYRIPEVSQGLVSAAHRGVRIQLIVESADISEGKIAYEALAGLGPDVAQVSAVYVWPKDKRLHDTSGRYGSLHVKCAIADETIALISSANLTGYAMNLNMELGVLVRGEVPRQVSAHIQELIASGILSRVSS